MCWPCPEIRSVHLPGFGPLTLRMRTFRRLTRVFKPFDDVRVTPSNFRNKTQKSNHHHHQHRQRHHYCRRRHHHRRHHQRRRHYHSHRLHHNRLRHHHNYYHHYKHHHHYRCSLHHRHHNYHNNHVVRLLNLSLVDQLTLHGLLCNDQRAEVL